MNGAQLLLDALSRTGPRPLFAAPGAPIGEAVGCRDARTAACAAEGWAKVTGRAGAVLLAAPEPVLIEEAALRRAPVVFFVLSDVAPSGPARWSVAVRAAGVLSATAQRALAATLASGPGPVLVHLSPTVLSERGKPDTVPERTRPPLEGDPEDLSATASALAVSQRPVVLLGEPWRFSTDHTALAPFLVRQEAPCFALGCAQGSLSPDSRFRFRDGAAAAIAAADLVLTFGVSGAHPLLAARAPEAFFIQVDLDPGALHPEADTAVRGDADRVMAALTELREDDGWLMQVEAFGQAHHEARSPALRALRERLDVLPTDHILVCDLPDAALPFAVRPGQLLTGPPGTGAGLAVGARHAAPGHTIIEAVGSARL